VKAQAKLPVPEAEEVDDEALEAGLCQLSERDQCVLRAWLLEEPDLAVMSKCGLTSTDMVRQQRRRAIARLREKILGLQTNREIDSD
jgi:DNA-directed RNA polymerase specialized sigma subunit